MVLQSLAVFIPFIIVSLPLLYYIVGKYHMHFVNRAPFTYVETIFILRNYKEMIRQNLSVSFIISAIGFVWFYIKFEQPLVRRILLNWCWIAVFMFVYSTIVASLDEHTNIHIPGTVPSFHYFFYLKALQSVFYGFGLYYITDPVFKWFAYKNFKYFAHPENAASKLFIALVLICGIIYYPFYQQRYDFVNFRKLCLQRARDSNSIDIYYYIRDHIPQDQVFLSEEKTSLFPVMATARKMVSNGLTFSNPYVDFGSRENARNQMLSYLRNGQPSEATDLFKKYGVNYVILTNSEVSKYKNLESVPSTVTYRNDAYTIFHLMQ
jgi:hypothetical protein